MLGRVLTREGDGVNEALRGAMAAAGLEQLDIAARLSVDPKTVERWIAGRIPHPRSRAAVARLVGVDEGRLWPAANDGARRGRFGGEVRAIYPDRSAVPRTVWLGLFERAESEVCILVYSGLFLAEDSRVTRLLAEKARTGVRVRVLLGDPDSVEVAQRGTDEGIGESMAARVRNALALLSGVAGFEDVQVRLHRTVLYNSIYRADDEMLVNTHIYGVGGSGAPVLHLCRTGESSMVSTYIASFERVWSESCDTAAL